MAKTRDKVSDAAGNVRPYVDRALHDEDLRDNLRSAFEAAREVYEELMGAGPPLGGRRASVASAATRAATDKDIQENLRTVVEELREAANRVQGKEDHTTRNTVLLVTGIALGLLFNPVTGSATRNWVRDRVFGGGGDDYTYGGGNSGGTTA